jgi:putative membrane protein
MRGLILRWLLAVLSLWLTSVILPGRIELDMRRPLAPFLVSLLLGLLNALVAPLLFAFKVITFPLQLLTVGLLAAAASFVLNGVFLYAIGHGEWVQGFYVPNFVSALYGALVLALINGVLSIVVRTGRQSIR